MGKWSKLWKVNHNLFLASLFFSLIGIHIFLVNYPNTGIWFSRYSDTVGYKASPLPNDVCLYHNLMRIICYLGFFGEMSAYRFSYESNHIRFLAAKGRLISVQTRVAAAILIIYTVQISPGKRGDKRAFILKVKSCQRFWGWLESVKLLGMGKRRLSWNLDGRNFNMVTWIAKL